MSAPKRPRSGVTVRKPPAPVDVLGGLWVDQENDGALGVFDEDFVTLAVDEEGDMTDGVSSQLGKPLLDEPPPGLPFTRASKSSSVAPLLSNVVPVTPPNARKSSLGPATAVAPDVPASSCSFLACSSSTRRERFLMSSIKVWN